MPTEKLLDMPGENGRTAQRSRSRFRRTERWNSIGTPVRDIKPLLIRTPPGRWHLPEQRTAHLDTTACRQLPMDASRTDSHHQSVTGSHPSSCPLFSPLPHFIIDEVLICKAPHTRTARPELHVSLHAACCLPRLPIHDALHSGVSKRLTSSSFQEVGSLLVGNVVDEGGIGEVELGDPQGQPGNRHLVQAVPHEGLAGQTERQAGRQAGTQTYTLSLSLMHMISSAFRTFPLLSPISFFPSISLPLFHFPTLPLSLSLALSLSPSLALSLPLTGCGGTAKCPCKPMPATRPPLRAISHSFCLRTHTYTCTHTHARKNARTYTHARTHARARTHTHTHTCMKTQTCMKRARACMKTCVRQHNPGR